MITISPPSRKTAIFYQQAQGLNREGGVVKSRAFTTEGGRTVVLDYLKVREEEAVYVKAERLKELVTRIFERLGVPQEDAAIAADVLVLADLRGVDSHGVSNYMERTYVPGLKDGRINPRPRIRIVRETPATALMDGDSGLGLVVGYRAMELAIRKAKEVGGAFVAVRNSRHFGMAGYYPMMALQHDMIGIAMTNAAPRTLPTFGKEPMVGTNPLSLAAPAGEEPAFVLDMATSTVAVGKVLIAARLGVPIPLGWATDEEGNPTTDSQLASRTLKMLPLGGSRELGGHKGYGLGVMVDILCGVLSGEGYGATLPRGRASHFFAAIDIAAFRPVEEFKRMMDEMIRALRNSAKAPGQDRIYVAGEPEYEIFQERRVKGIPLHRDVVDYLEGLSREMGLEYSLLG
jgi:LDH2 family malate/lactate/ureidoglycolate dehydrogenase